MNIFRVGEPYPFTPLQLAGSQTQTAHGRPNYMPRVDHPRAGVGPGLIQPLQEPYYTAETGTFHLLGL